MEGIPKIKIVIFLIHVVFTTGTTVEECSKELLKEGALEVQVLTLARVGVTGS